jgi:hypothetical protein
LSKSQERENKKKSHIRVRVEHIFGYMDEGDGRDNGEVYREGAGGICDRDPGVCSWVLHFMNIYTLCAKRNKLLVDLVIITVLSPISTRLDPEMIGEVLNMIKEPADGRMTMPIVTHKTNFTRDIADTLLFIEGGVIVESDSPGVVFKNPREERPRCFLNLLL